MQTNIRQCKKKIVDKTISNETQSDEQKHFAETVLMVKKPNGQGQMLRVLFDSGCSKTIILKCLLTKREAKDFLILRVPHIRLMVVISPHLAWHGSTLS